MQTVSRYLLDNLVIVYTSGYIGRNSKVYDRRIGVFKGVNNPISFIFKNEDQKAQVIAGNNYEFNLIDTESNRSVLTKSLIILDDGSTFTTRGTAQVIITASDLLLLDAEFYNYSIRQIASDGSRTVTFSDTAYSAAGTVEILDDAYPMVVDSVEINNFEAVVPNPVGGPYQMVSGAQDAGPGGNSDYSALHTIAVYTQLFNGTFKIQATMSETPTDRDWFDVSTSDGDTTITFSTVTGVTYFNFNGIYSFVRFIWQNTPGPTGYIDPSNIGFVDKILYRH